MENMFEKTMLTCLESKKSKKSTNKKLNESLAKRVKPLTEAEEMDLSYDLPEDEENQEVMDDVQDDILVVVDPELDADEVEGAAAEAQEIVDGTPEGEVPSTDEYIGDMTYTCPICGNTFFSEVEMNEGDQCPVCGETPSGFVLAGEVAEAEDAPAEEEVPAEEPAEEPAPEEPAEDIPAEEVPEEEEELEEESCKPGKKCSGKECEEELDVKEGCKKESKKVVRARFQIDESTFNPYMSKFIRENYKNARSFKITGATLNKNRVLTMECVITFKSGNTKKVNLKTEGFRAFNGKRAYIDFKEDGAFKTESKSKVAPFIFTTSMRNNVLKCEGMKYNFVSKISENKKTHIYGKVVNESRNFR